MNGEANVMAELGIHEEAVSRIVKVDVRNFGAGDGSRAIVDVIEDQLKDPFVNSALTNIQDHHENTGTAPVLHIIYSIIAYELSASETASLTSSLVHNSYDTTYVSQKLAKPKIWSSHLPFPSLLTVIHLQDLDFHWENYANHT